MATLLKHKQFRSASAVTTIHLLRYEKQIQKLLSVQDYSEQDLLEGKVDKSTFMKARGQKLKAMNDILDTLNQKERLLQMHSSGFEVEIVQERVEVRQNRPNYNIHKLSFDEQVELMELIQKAKKPQSALSPISGVAIQSDEIDVEFEIVKQEVPNVQLIEHEKFEVQPNQIPITHKDPAIRIKEAMARLQLRKIKDAGGKLTDEEKKMLSE